MLDHEPMLKRRRWMTWVTVFLLMWIAFGAGLYGAGRSALLERLAVREAVFAGKLLGQYSEPEAGKLAADVDFKLFWEVWDTLHELYVDQTDLSDKKLFYGAIRGMVGAVGDPYTVFMDPKIATDFAAELAGSFEGIGAEIGIKNETLIIIAPLPDSPSAKAGLKAGDKVLAIDGSSTAGIQIDDAIARIRGKKGTTVTLTIARDGVDGVRDVPIIRDTIVVKSLTTEETPDGAYIIRIGSFNEDTTELFNEAVRDIVAKAPRGLILDLRNNPGGFLDSAIEMSSEWVEEGPVVIERYTAERETPHLARGRARLKDLPTVVLVNRGSASASEIVSGALQDTGKAVIVGEQTFGKGSVQTLTNFGDGSSVKVTVAKWLTPKGRSINDEGIAPDVVVAFTPEDFEAGRDPQLDRAKAIIAAGGLTEELMATSTPVISTTTDPSE